MTGHKRGRADATAPSDRALILACREGDGRAWKRLLKKYERLVYSIPRRYGLSREDAADGSQLTFTVLIQSLDGLSLDGRLGAWLATVARRHTWRLLGRHRLEATSRHTEHLSERAALLGGSDTDSIEHWELTEWLTGGLSKMDEPCRSLLTTLYFWPERPSYAEIAARMDVSVGSIGPTRARCLKRLKRALGEA